MRVSRRQAIATAGGIGAAAVASALHAEPTVDRGHVVLLGDSIFDNKAYVGSGPAVIDQVKQQLGAEWDATLCAVDGDVTRGIKNQLARMPRSATHVIVSVGGNDALMCRGVLGNRVNTAADAFSDLAAIQHRFGQEYDEMLKLVLSYEKPVAVCTIYDPDFDDPTEQRISVAALSVFNDRITRSAFSRGIPVIDLRLLFTEKEDYANPIEPSSVGGLKIAKLIRRIVRTHDFNSGQSTVYDAVAR